MRKSSVDVKVSQEELNQVKNLPDVVYPTREKKVTKEKISALFGKNIDFFAPQKGNAPKSNIQYGLPQKVVLDSTKPIVTKQQVQRIFLVGN